MVLLGASFVLFACSALSVGAHAQSTGCRFLLDNCEPQKKGGAPTVPRTDPSDNYLEECLSFYLRCHGGHFVPEGQSTAHVKSRSDMTAMCAFAIGQRNYYWRSYGNRCS